MTETDTISTPTPEDKAATLPQVRAGGGVSQREAEKGVKHSENVLRRALFLLTPHFERSVDGFLKPLNPSPSATLPAAGGKAGKDQARMRESGPLPRGSLSPFLPSRCHMII